MQQERDAAAREDREVSEWRVVRHRTSSFCKNFCLRLRILSVTPTTTAMKPAQKNICQSANATCAQRLDEEESRSVRGHVLQREKILLQRNAPTLIITPPTITNNLSLPPELEGDVVGCAVGAVAGRGRRVGTMSGSAMFAA